MGALPRPRRPAPAPAAPPRGGRRSGAGNGGASGRAAARLRPPAPRSSPRAAVPGPPPPRAARRVEEAGTPLRGRSVTKGTRGNKPNRGARLATWHGYRFTRDHGRDKTKASPRVRPTAWYCLWIKYLGFPCKHSRHRKMYTPLYLNLGPSREKMARKATSYKT